MLDIETIKSIISIVSEASAVLVLFLTFLNWFFDYKFNQKMAEQRSKRQKRTVAPLAKVSNGKQQ